MLTLLRFRCKLLVVVLVACLILAASAQRLPPKPPRPPINTCDDDCRACIVACIDALSKASPDGPPPGRTWYQLCLPTCASGK